MLHTWQNAAYLGDLNFGKRFGEKVGKKVGKSLEKVKMTEFF
jgi:hypothetical protein